MLNSIPQLWPLPTPGDHDWTNLNHFEAFLAKQFLRRRFLKIYSIYSFVKFHPPLWPHPIPGDHNLNKLESPLHVNASISVTVFLAYKYLRWRFLKIFSIYSYVKFHRTDCGPTLFPGTITWTNLNLHYLSMLPNKLMLFGLTVFKIKIF